MSTKNPQKETMSEYILCAAIEYGDLIISGYRHNDCILIMSRCKIGNRQDRNQEYQGFLTSKNRFVDRAEAFEIAKAANQIINNGVPYKEGVLFSEDLY